MLGSATVQIGCRVRLRDQDGQERSIRIRGDGQESWAADSVTADTPLARALVGHQVGDLVDVVVHPALPTRQVTILGIE